MVNYDKSIIYKICCKDPSIADEYVGSTVNFTRRKSQHKSNCCNENRRQFNYKVYQTIRDNGGWNNWDMVEVERFSAQDRKDLHARERFWIEEMKSTLNRCIPTQTPTEYYQKNKETINKHKAEYRQNNKEKIAEYKATYRQKNKEKIYERGAEYRQKNKGKISERGAEYRQKNKEKISERDAEYRQKNKGKIAERCAKKIQCECGCVIARHSLSQHLKTTKHKKLMEEK